MIQVLDLCHTSRLFAASSGKNRDLSPVYPYLVVIYLGVTAKACGLLGLKIFFRSFLGISMHVTENDVMEVK